MKYKRPLMYTRQMKVYLLDNDYDAWLILAERIGLKPATLARQVMVEYLMNNGFKSEETKKLLPSASGNVGIYFKLNADEAAVLDQLAWEQHKIRQTIVRDFVRKGLQEYLMNKAWRKHECEND